jgi:hypothetical protein
MHSAPVPRFAPPTRPPPGSDWTARVARGIALGAALGTAGLAVGAVRAAVTASAARGPTAVEWAQLGALAGWYVVGLATAGALVGALNPPGAGPVRRSAGSPRSP